MITLKPANAQAVRYACMNYHYAKAVPSAYNAYNVYNEHSEWCGVIIFGGGATPRLAGSVGCKTGEVMELVRVALNGKQPCTSECVGAALRQLHRDAPQVKIVVSFADCDQQHYGTIYQATNWIYLGTNSGNGYRFFIIHGKKTHPKSVHSQGWKQSLGWLREHVDPNAQEVYSEGKRKYIWVYDKKFRKEWQKNALPYPKKPCVSSSTAEQPAILRENGGSTPTLTLQ